MDSIYSARRRLAAVVLLSLAVVLVWQVWFLTPPEAKAAPGTRPTLAWGSRGADVRLVQEKLRQWGYYKGAVDGVYGRQTYAAVQLFQRRNGLSADGVVGRATYEALGINYFTAGGTTTGGTTVSRGGGATSNDVRLLAQLVRGEAEAEPYTGMVAVAAVCLNRVSSSQFPNTVAGVVYQPGAFETVSNGRINLAPSDVHLRAARDAVNGWDPTYGALFFWNPSKPVNAWIWSRRITLRIGRHVFAL